MAKARNEKSSPSGRAPQVIEARGGAARATVPDSRVGAQSPALAAIRDARSRGNVRAARALATQLLTSGTPGEQAEARAMLEETRVDPGALLAAAIVFVVIVAALWAAIFHAR